MFLESPLIKELLKKRQRGYILRVLTLRFGELPADLASLVDKIKGKRRLDNLFEYSIICPNLEAFRTRLFSRTNGS